MGKKRNKVTVKKKRSVEKYTSLYSDKQYEKDEKSFNKAKDISQIDINTFKRLAFRDICLNTNIIESGYIGYIKIEDAAEALKNPKSEWRTLLAVSDELMRISPHYYRMNKMYSNAALFCWGIDIYGIRDGARPEAIKKSYLTLAEKLESMNLKHEFSKIMNYLPYQDIYCGLVFENQHDFFVQQIDYRICKLYEVQDGIYNFIINLAEIKPTTLHAYPSYVQQAYIDFDESENKVSNWYKPPADKQVCLKLNNQWTYPYPLLIGLVKDILDLDIYKKLKLQSARTDNYKAIMIKVPIDESTIDKPLLTPDTLAFFAEINKENMTDDIGIIHTLGSNGEAISFKDSNNTRNNVSDAEDAIYDASGLTKELFNGSSSGTAVTFSVENDSGFIYGLYRQYERWINRFIKARKYNKSNYKFSFYLLDITIFNRDIVSKRYKDAIALGVTVIDKYLASMDMTPSRILGSFVTHQDIYNFHENFIPLQTSYNASSEEAGRPTNKSQGKTLDTSGEQTEDSDANKNR